MQIGNKKKKLEVSYVHDARYFEVPLRIVGHVKMSKDKSVSAESHVET
jgi:hypothetical protein